MKIIMKGASILMAVFMFSMVLTPVFAAPPLPFDREGNAPVNDTYITSWIDGTEYGNDTTDGVGDFFLATQSDETLPDGKKTGGQDGVGDIIQYAIGDLTGTETATFFTETDAFLIGGYSPTGPNADLSNGDVVRLLKINNISFASQYVVIHNPTSIAVDMDTYSIAVGVGGPQAIAATDYVDGMYMWNVNSIPAGGYFALDMGKITAIGGANAIELSISGHIVDKVEYGAIATEPENTLLRNAAAPGATEIQRVAPGSDSNDCNADFAAGPEFLPLDLVNPIVTCVDLGVIGIATLEDATATDPAPSSGIATYAWTQIGGPGVVAFGSAATEDTTVAGTIDGLYTCQLEVTDVAGNSGTDTFTFTWDSTIPTVTVPDLGWINVATLMDATAADANGIATYAWTQTAGPGITTFGTPAVEDSTVAGTIDGTYTVQLEVTDNVGLTNTDTGTYGWDITPPTVTCVDLGDIGVTPTLENAVTADVTSGIASYSWADITVAGAGVVVFDDNAIEDPTVSATADDTYTCELTVTDNAGNTNTDTFTFTWTTPPEPTATVMTIAPATPTNDPTPAIDIAHTQMSIGDEIDLYYSLDGANWLNYQTFTVTTDSPFTETYAVNALGEGTYYFAACPTIASAADPALPAAAPSGDDELGPWVLDLTPPTVTCVDLGNIGTTPTLENAVTSDALSGIASYAWADITIAGAGVVVFDDNAIEDPTVSATADDTYTCELTVTDNAGNTNTDTFTFTWETIGGGVSPTDIWANKSAGNVRLEWSDGTGPFEIYISASTDGSGFNFGAPDATIATYFWEDVGVIDDGNDYSYVVRATGDATNSEISWKIEKPIYSTGSTDQNWVSLPYRTSYADLSDIGDDIGNAAISKVTTWSPINPPAEQQFRSVTWDDLFSMWGGSDDAVVPGTMVMITCKDGQDFNWNIVGSHISGTTLQMYSTGSTDQNWFSLPYHCTYADLSDIGDDIGNAAISKVTTWSPINPPAEQQFRSVTWDDLFSMWGGSDDAVVAGTGIMLTVKDGQDGPWTPTVNPIGA